MDTLVIGLDGGEWDVINPLIADGRLPNIARLKNKGVSGPLKSTTPPVSPLAWNSIQTGTNPGKHGIFDFGTFDQNYLRQSINSTNRKATPFWRIMNDHGASTGLFKFPFMYPPSDVSGYIVTGFPTPNTVDDFATPESLVDEVGPVNKLFEDSSLKSESLAEFRQNLTNVAERQTEIFLQLVEEHPTDFAMTVYDGSDRIQHFFWKYYDQSHPRYEPDSPLAGAIEQYYETLDKGIGRILDEVNDDCDILVLSDHGFGPLSHDIHIDEWLEEEGLLSRRSADSSQKTAGDAVASTLRLGWNTVKWANLDNTIKSIIPSDWLEFGRNFEDESRRDTIWNETDVFFTTLSGQALYINLEDRFAEGTVSEDRYDTVVENTINSLLSVQHPETGEELIEAVYRTDEIYTGWAVEEAPDLVVETKPEYTLKGGRSESLLQPSSQKGSERSGDHRMKGILIANGPSFDEGTTEGSSVIDIAPTLLYLHQLPVPTSMDGGVLTNLLSGEIQNQRTVEQTSEYGQTSTKERQWTAEEEAELEKRLDDMGYLG